MSQVVHLHRHGAPSVLQTEEREVPTPGAGEVLVRQTAVGLNYLDVYFRRGEKSTGQFPFVNGFEGAGRVEAVGPDVTDFAVGDRVAYNLAIGAYAAHRLVPAAKLVSVPDAISDDQAAAMMLAGTTAEFLVRRLGVFEAGDTVLVHAASGGVGTILTQWLSYAGARVIGTVGSPEKAERARRNGVDHAIDYGNQDFVREINALTDRQGVKVIFDGVGRATFSRGFECLATFGTNVLIGWASGEVEPIDVHALNARSHSVVNPSVGHYTATRAQLVESTKALFDVVERGVVRIDPGAVYPLSSAAEAHQDLEDRKIVGPAILRPEAA